jgi:hypothetical protein
MSRRDEPAQMSKRSSVARVVAAAGGDTLAAGTQALARMRAAAKPLHPLGEVRAAHIHRTGAGERTGVVWLDEPGEDRVEVRLSRALGLPPGLPDIHGLAVRIHAPDGPADLLFATTGRGRLSRFVLTVARHTRNRPMTTLLPYRTDRGALLLCAENVGADTYELSWAQPTSRWHVFGTLHTSPAGGEDPAISFDPVLHQLAGLDQYPSVRRLREPSYLRARRSRRNHTSARIGR